MTATFTADAIIQAAKDAISKSGLTPPANIEPGKITRFGVNGSQNKDAWAILYINDNGTAGAAYGNWQAGWKENWFYNDVDITTSQREELRKQIREAQVQAEKERQEVQAKAAKEAQAILNNAGPADPGHAYLNQKQVGAYGLKQTGDTLLVPVMYGGQIYSLQKIQPDGSKRFHSGGRTKGCYLVIGDMDQADCYRIAEGYATGATIHEVTHSPVVICFNSGNMLEVAKKFKAKHPDKKQIICADNDLATNDRKGINPGRKAGEKAAKATGAELCICPVDSDFNDLHCSQGLNAVTQALKNAGVVKTWDLPIDLDENQPPAMDPNILPGPVGDMARAETIETETPIELATGLGITAIATACQGKIIIEVKPGYREPLNLWVIVALDPANRKTSVLSRMTAPLTAWEREQHKQMEPWVKEAASRRQNQESRLKSLRTKYGKAKPDELKEIEAEILEIENDLEEIPVFPKAWAQDVTPEHLGTLMSQHNERMSILSAEGGIFDIAAGRYSSGVPNLDLFLQGHAGDAVRVDRGSREPVYMDNPALTFGLSPQPGVLKGLSDKPGFRSRGLLARFNYFLPTSKLGYRVLETTPVPESIKTNYHNLIFQLMNIEPGQDEHGETKPHVLTLSKAAYQEWAEFYNIVERDLRDDGRFEHVRDWAGKLPGAAARIAGLLHCAGNPHEPWTVPVSLGTMTTALDLAAVFADHALIAFDLMGADTSLDEARKVWRWIERNRLESFSKRDCHNALQGSFKRVKELEEPLIVLIERNYIQAETKPTGGRPSIIYRVNPEIIKGWS